MHLELFIFLSIFIILFIIALLGIFLVKKHIVVILMSIELMLLSINLNFIIFSVYLDDISGQLFAIFILTVAAAESAIGLALIVAYYRIHGIISVNFISTLKG